jgi:hypothetical protein
MIEVSHDVILCFVRAAHARPQLDVVDYVRHHQAVCNPDGHFPFGENHSRHAELLKNAPVQGRDRLGNNRCDAQLAQLQW